MRLPDRLDYVEVSDAEHWWPQVVCIVHGCAWFYDATWDEIGDDDHTNWDEIHPAHTTTS